MNAVTNSYRTEHYSMTLKKSVSPEGVSELRKKKNQQTKKTGQNFISTDAYGIL